MSGRLVVVATPIGNLGDLSDRARASLASADVVLAEDTRRTGTLLRTLGVRARQLSLHEHNELERIPAVLELLRQGATVVLVSDAGTPLVSDPGWRLVRACIDAGLPVEHVPGPSAAIAALVVSGLPTDRWVFEGFLPRRGPARRRRLAELSDEPRTVVLFLSPHRAAAELAELAAVLGEDRPAALCRELTKLHEEVWRGTLGELARRAAADPPRGELTLVVGGAPPPATPDLARLVAEVEGLVAAGRSRRDAVAEVAARWGVSKRALYQAVVEAGGGSGGGGTDRAGGGTAGGADGRGGG